MKKLTKKSLDELAKTMSVIDESEQDTYWGRYENDYFWRCVAYLKGDGTSEEAAESYAEDYFSSLYGLNTQSLLACYGAEVNNQQISSYSGLDNNKKKLIMGFPPSALSNYGFSGDTNHLVVFKGTDSNGNPIMFCPQTNTSFTMSLSDYGQRIF
jgi:hypothetical protein